MASDTDLQLTSSTGVQRFNWTGLDPKQMKGVAQAMAMSGMFPDIARDSAKAFVKIMAGQEMGIPPFQAMSDISIISGKAAAGGNIYASKVKAHPRYDYHVNRWDRKGCDLEFSELKTDGKWKTLGVSSFTEEDAADAQLLGKDSWKKYPRNMYFNRAMTAGVRTYCPDALNGINAYTPEELGAEVDDEGRAIVHSNASFPQAASRQRTEVGTVDNQDLSTSDAESAQDVDNSLDEYHQDVMDRYEEQQEAIPEAQQLYRVPTFPIGSGKLIHPGMTKQIKSWLAELELNEAEVATLMHSTIGKAQPGNYEEGQQVLEALAEELNLRHAANREPIV